MIDASQYLGSISPAYNYAAFQHRNNLGQTLDFERRPWLVDLYTDPAREKVIEKASQVGISELAIIFLIMLAQEGRSGLYVLPTDSFRNDFMRERFNPMLDHNPELKANVGAAIGQRARAADAMAVKMIYGVPWKFVGARNVANFFSFRAGAILVDEFNLCDQDNLALAEDRLGFEEQRVYYKFGNPTLPGFGIDAEYEGSDQKEWFVKCARCNEWQILNFWNNVVRQTGEREYELRDPNFPPGLDPAELDFEDNRDAHVYCSKCERSIDRLARGLWVMAYPKRRVSGYRVGKIFADARRRNVILEMVYGKKGLMESLGNLFYLARFYNNVLGEPFRAPGSCISFDLMEKCLGDKNMSYDPVLDENDEPIETIGGADIGGVHNVILSRFDEEGVREYVYVGTVPNFESLEQLVQDWNCVVGVVDARPETEKARAFCLNNPGWYCCEYLGNHKLKTPFKVDHIEQWIQADRTQTLDGAYADFHRRNVRLPLDIQGVDDGEFVRQMEASVRKLVDSRGGPLYVWDEGNKKDHYRHADNYNRMAGKIHQGGGDILEAA